MYHNECVVYSILQKDNIRKLRKQGYSLNQIVLETGVPKSTFRGWIKELSLTSEQKKKLQIKSFSALQAGRVQAQNTFKRSRKEKELIFFEEGRKETNGLQKRELFLAGVALYWAEGFKNKHEKRLGFCNSDPKMIKFYLKWLEVALGVEKSRLTARLTINSEHKDREEEIHLYWKNITGLSSDQFTKTFYQNVIWKKKYENRGEYYGVLRLHVKESLEYLLKMRGWIDGLGNILT
jgi:hypothetical protein